MAFNFLKKKKEEVPDVGKETSEDAEKEPEESEEDFYSDDKDEEESDVKVGKEKQKKQERKSPVAYAPKNIEFEKASAKIDALSELIKGYSERLSTLSQQIGEVRAMTLANEKEITKVSSESGRAIDIVKEVQPDKLRIDYQRLNMRIDALSEKLEGNKQLIETIMNELKDLRRKAGIFIGTEALLKLNEEVKKDLIEIQKTSSRVNLNADKSEQIFIELKKGFTENQKINEIVANLDSSYSGLKKEFEKLTLDYSKIVSQDELNDFKKSFENKMAIFEGSMPEIEKTKNENERLGRLIEKILAITKRNKEDISDIAITIGDEHIKSVSDYEDRLDAILKIIDALAGQVSEIKKLVGMKKEIHIKHGKKSVIGKKKIHLKHMKIHPKISKKLVSKEPEVPEVVQKIQESSDDKDRILNKVDGKNNSPFKKIFKFFGRG